MGLFMLFNYDIDEIRKLKLVAEVKGQQVWQLFVVAIVAHLIFSYFIRISAFEKKGALSCHTRSALSEGPLQIFAFYDKQESTRDLF